MDTFLTINRFSFFSLFLAEMNESYWLQPFLFLARSSMKSMNADGSIGV
jgi:hypothetical protein